MNLLFAIGAIGGACVALLAPPATTPAVAANAAAPVPAADGDAAASRFREHLEVVGKGADDAGEAARRHSLERAELERLPAETLAEVLAELPGAVVYFASPFGGTPMVVLRGFFGGGEVDYVGLEVDGVPRAASETGVADWSGIRLDELERIDLLAGPVMRRGGVDPALAGLLRLATRPADGIVRRSASLSYASFATFGAAAGWSGRAGEAAHLQLTADLRGTEGYRRNNAATRDGGARVVYDRGAGADHRLVFSAFGRSRDREEPGPLSAAELAVDPLASNALFDHDREDAEVLAASLRFDGPWNGVPFEGHLAADSRRSRFLRTLLVAEGYGDSALRRAETASFSAGASIPGEIPLGERCGLRLSADFRHEEADTRYADPLTGAPRAADRASRGRWVGEAGLAFRPADRLELDLSVRGDRIEDRSDRHGDRDADAFSPRLAAVWALAGDERRSLQLFGEYGRAFKAPTLDQLYDPRPFLGPDGEFNLSNPDLEPQESRGGELGVRGQGPRTGWHLLAYRQILENEIDFDPATFRYANIGRSRHQGIEASWRIEAGAAGAFRATYARSAAFAEGEHPTGQLKNIPREMWRLGWNARFAGFEIGLEQTFLAGRWADDAHLFVMDDVRRTDLRLARQLGGMRLRADFLNLFDDDSLELAYLLPAQGGSGEVLHGFAPAPRAVRLGVETSW